MDHPVDNEEDLIADAIDAFDPAGPQSLKDLARAFGVRYNKLWRRYRQSAAGLDGMRLKGASRDREAGLPRVGLNRRMNRDQEAELCRFIDLWIADHRMRPTHSMIEDEANVILQRAHLEAGGEGEVQPVGGLWVYRFLQRHPEYARSRHADRDEDRVSVCCGWLRCCLVGFGVTYFCRRYPVTSAPMQGDTLCKRAMSDESLCRPL